MFLLFLYFKIFFHLIIWIQSSFQHKFLCLSKTQKIWMLLCCFVLNKLAIERDSNHSQLMSTVFLYVITLIILLNDNIVSNSEVIFSGSIFANLSVSAAVPKIEYLFLPYLLIEYWYWFFEVLNWNGMKHKLNGNTKKSDYMLRNTMLNPSFHSDEISMQVDYRREKGTVIITSMILNKFKYLESLNWMP